MNQTNYISLLHHLVSYFWVSSADKARSALFQLILQSYSSSSSLMKIHHSSHILGFWFSDVLSSDLHRPYTVFTIVDLPCWWWWQEDGEGEDTDEKNRECDESTSDLFEAAEWPSQESLWAIRALWCPGRVNHLLPKRKSVWIC